MAWSSQRYISAGLKLGFSPDVLNIASEQLEQHITGLPPFPALLTLNHLAKRTNVPYLELRPLVRGQKPDAYHHFYIRKKSGGHRRISVPEPTLMRIQQWIATHILNIAPVHQASYAFSPGSSIYKCAYQHRKARWLIKMDVTGFFGSISEIQVYRVFRSFGYQPLIAFELARLTTYAPISSPRYLLKEWQARTHSSPIDDYHRANIGYLPQGAPTSPMLSNLVMRSVDERIAKIAEKYGLRYTRYSDDITFSTTAEFDRKRARDVIRSVTKMLTRVGLHVNAGKTVVVPPGGRKVVLGLLVDGPEPKLSRDFRSNLRQHIFFLESLGPMEHAKARGFETISGMYRHIRGLIDFANMVDADYAAELLSRFQRVNWPFAIP
ncbi:reverse transcriptase family protein [Neorhizobium galegae]|uniref:reverse transcriptase family protein n=1 Tax=Neorhizobium galegae TaxID=399 RepID=UPI002104C31F|nr:reverse transcriptase family protein [Neorhizobium galegae]MCQ1835159.1 reverse transcriptase family protein [Neorhizobium galegae]UIY29123.1 reverse transcriptase family protein [Neorhizobium galegae]